MLQFLPVYILLMNVIGLKPKSKYCCHYSSQNPPEDFNWHKDLLLIAFGAVALTSHLSTNLYPYCLSLHPSHTSLQETKHTPSFPWYLCGSLPFFLKSYLNVSFSMNQSNLHTTYALLWFFSILFIIIKYSVHFTGSSDLLCVSPHRMNILQEQGFWWFCLFFWFLVQCCISST